MPVKNVIEVARGELGVTENPPGSNRVKYWDEYGAGWQGQPWCVCFLWWVFHHAGEGSAFFGGAKTASCGTLLRWYNEQGLTVPKKEVQPGDIVILNFSGTPETQHCGLVVDRTVVWDSFGNVNKPDSFFRVSSIKTIEGNTSPGEEGSQDNGGCVALKTRHISQIVEICRPKYKEEVKPVIPDDDYSTHWAVKDIDLAIERGLMKGYPDGTFKPDKPVTRAELAVVLNRLYDIMKVK